MTELWLESGYTMKYRLSPREIPRAQAIFHRIPRLESQYSLSQLPLLANIFLYWLRELAIFYCIGFVIWPNMGPYTAYGVYGPVLDQLTKPIRENIASLRSQYEKILASRGNWEWLCCDSSRGIRWNIAWALGKFLGLKQYFIIYPSFRHNTVTRQSSKQTC